GEIKLSLSQIEAQDKYPEGMLQLCVRDSGPGIPKHELETVFEFFYQGDQNLYSKKYSSGIGLSLAKDIVLLHHGEIFVESQSEEDGQPTFSSFYICIPLGNAHLKAEEMLQDILQNQSSPNKELTNTMAQTATLQADEASEIAEHIPLKERKMVLLVDDNEEILQFLYRQLNKNYQVNFPRPVSMLARHLSPITPDSSC
ncbi:ATP-binding protein, partial [Escherichia coli]|nr:ATP-binding protein [Escherichia coli]